MIALINYGLGNVMAIANIYRKLNIPIKVAKNSHDLRGSTKLILPGVGSFDWAIQLLHKSNMLDEINELVLSKKVPVLGICVGMQIMTKSSEEGELQGLDWINANVIKFTRPDTNNKIILPHMGWNKIKYLEQNNLFLNIDKNPRFYFLHSYYVQLRNEKNAVAQTNYFNNFTSVFQKDNIYGVQFHPEKSHKDGVQLLQNFANL